MNTVLYTLRVEIIKSYGERRDCADQRIVSFLEQCGFLPVSVPNVFSRVERYLEEINPVGIVLTGGNNLVNYGGDAAERDRTERTILEAAILKKIPVYGICRGMQMLLDYFGTPLKTVEGHVGTRHDVAFEKSRRLVNSYHAYGTDLVKKPLIALARSSDGMIEEIVHENLKIAGIMWHPEREEPFREEDIKRVKELFFVEGSGDK